MSTLNGRISKAQEHAHALAYELAKAHQDANAIERPEGRNVMDKALTAYLAECLDASRRLEAKLNELGN